MLDRGILPGGEGRVDVLVPASHLHPGRSRIIIDLETGDPSFDESLTMAGTVVATSASGGLRIDGGLLPR